ncbi:hypothetical protein [Pyxidicoccus trucidator]|uniref:hypothetical protein n=1 Tax=Pyxidicoccus trucidator TaxID=2709662 RepID=UPI0013DB5200|nr:hypothetical protein [Pyxidicoccus trucidator]
MTDDRGTPPSHARAAAAMKLLLWAQVALLGLSTVSQVVRDLHSALGSSDSRESFRTAMTVLVMVNLVPMGVLAFGLPRFAAALADARVRPWGYVAGGLRGLGLVGVAGLQVLPLMGWNPMSVDAWVRMLPGLVLKLSFAALLLMGWLAGRALRAHHARGLLLFATGAWVVDLAGFFVLAPGSDLSRELMNSSSALASTVNNLRSAVSLTLQAAIAGLFFQLHTALVRPEDAPATSPSWTSAASGLSLYNWGLRGRIAVAILSVATPWLFSAFHMYGAGELLGGLIAMAALPCFMLMVAGLVRYSLRLEVPGAATHSQMALGFMLVAATLLLTNSLQSFRGFEHGPMSGPMLSTGVAGALSFVAVLFLLASFHHAATASQAAELARSAFQVGRLLAVSGGVAIPLVFFDTEQGVLRVLAAVAWLGALVGTVRFIVLVGRMAVHLRGGASSAPEANLFART